jgi:hypothetical protein
VQTSDTSAEPVIPSENASGGDGQPVAPARETAALGRLEVVKIREYWKDESQDFTPWLAREENLELLGDTVGLNLELVGTRAARRPVQGRHRRDRWRGQG